MIICCFSVPVISCLSFLALPMTRFLLSELVSHDERGMYHHVQLHFISWWWHAMETMQALLVLFEGNPVVTDRKYPHEGSGDWIFSLLVVRTTFENLRFARNLNRDYGHGTSQKCYRVTGLCAGNSPVTGEFQHKGPVTRKMFPFDDVIMDTIYCKSALIRGFTCQSIITHSWYVLHLEYDWW